MSYIELLRKLTTHPHCSNLQAPRYTAVLESLYTGTLSPFAQIPHLWLTISIFSCFFTMSSASSKFSSHRRPVCFYFHLPLQHRTLPSRHPLGVVGGFTSESRFCHSNGSRTCCRCNCSAIGLPQSLGPVAVDASLLLPRKRSNLAACS